ncbi:helix-turn-helix domain-containing protein [Tenacibaculum maritimum]|uniref:helix-turn-helix domain-containing protein n=1 Tax=Tenacibaculum maritimum TaxID=107401 RepID=UPI0012E540BF|nr:helix-turn-helix domain-containing protein [Tenacibaculum maritimum]CAA0186627.1 conserved hypothetical protein [Tenacibaculum maritimum]CAA0221885.1 conserved hypothetical protein [Tenacibaculum maritimum]
MSEAQIIESNIKAMTIFNANDKMMSVSECAEFMGIHQNTVKNRIEKEDILATFQGGKYHIPKLQFVKLLVEKFLKNENEVAENEDEVFDKKIQKWFHGKIAS